MLARGRSIVNRTLERLLSAFADVGDRHLFEIAAVLTQRKRAVRVVVPVSQIQEMEMALKQLGLVVALPRVAHAIERETSLGDRFTTTVPYGDPRATEAALVASLDRATAEIALDIDEKGSARAAGEIYEYPPCCIEAYEHIGPDRDWIDLLIDSARGNDRKPDYLVNKIAYLFDGASLLPDYFPCSLYCSGARSLALNHREAALQCGLSHRVKSVEEALKKPIVLWRGNILQVNDKDDHDLSVTLNNSKCHQWRTHRPDADNLFHVARVRMSPEGLILQTPTFSYPPDSLGLIIKWKD